MRHKSRVDIITIIVASLGLLGCVVYAMSRCSSTYTLHWYYWDVSAIVAFGILNATLFVTGFSNEKSWACVMSPRLALAFGVGGGLASGALWIMAFKSIWAVDVDIMTHLIYVLSLTGVFMGLDWIIFMRAKRTMVGSSHDNEALIYDRFNKTFYFIDIPTVTAFGTLLVLLWKVSPALGKIESVPDVTTVIPAVHYNFLIGGAIAFQLITSIVAFLAITFGANRSITSRFKEAECLAETIYSVVKVK